MEKYRELFVETILQVVDLNDFCFYSILSDKIITKEWIKKFKITYDNGMKVYYQGRLLQEFKDWELVEFLHFKNLVGINNKNFGKDCFENFLICMRKDESMIQEFIGDVIKSPFCNLRDLEYVYGRYNLSKMLQNNNNMGYTKFTISELDEYKDFVCWEHVLQNRKEIDNEFLSRFRVKLRSHIRTKYKNSFYHEIKYITYWICLNPNTSWERIERYLKCYSYYKDFPVDWVKEISRKVEFPKEYYYNHFIENNPNCFKQFGGNIDYEELKNNIHMPQEIIQKFVEEVKEGKLRNHEFKNYYYLTIQQFLQLIKVNKYKYIEDDYCFKTFGVYQYQKYKKIIEENPIIMDKFSNMLIDSSNGLNEYLCDN
jgi:hypothetical protein